MSVTINLTRSVSRSLLKTAKNNTSSLRTLSNAPHPEFLPAEDAVRQNSAQADTMTEIGIREIFNSDHDILRASSRKFYDDEIKPCHEQWERDGFMPKEIFRKAGNAGQLCCMVPEEYGGPGGDFLDQVVMCEEQAYSNCSAPGFDNHSLLPTPYILRFGTEKAKQTFLPEMVTGKIVGSLAMTEPSAGSDLQAMKSRAVQDGDDWVLNGSKIFISNGIISDISVVAALTDPSAKSKAKGMGLFIVDTTADGFKRGRNLKKLGMKGQDTGELFFEDVRVPSWCVLGGHTKGFNMLMQNLPLERLSIAMNFIAHAEFMFEETRKYVKERHAFGKPLIKLQVVAHKMADLKMQICSTRAFVDNCIVLQKDLRLTSPTASMAKVLATDVANKVAYDCLQLHGGYGYMEEYPICRAYRDVRIGPIYGGTNEIMKELIARTIAA